jgi:hypothetical protein
MQTIREPKTNDISPTRVISSNTTVQLSANQTKKLKIREYISWSVCFVIISGLTGLMKLLKIGVTMDSVTSILFFLSLGGLTYFISKIYLFSRNPVRTNSKILQELN